MDKITKRILFAFDFDHTILVENTDTLILKLLSEKAKLDLKPKYESRDNWAHFMQEVYHKMKEEGVTIDQVKQIILEMQFNPGFLDLFSYIKDNKDIFETVIISGSNTVFLNWILNKHNLNELFPIFYTNHAHPDEDCVINIKPYHTHDCEKCDNSQCKRIILDEHISTLENQNF
jgi:2,3-diketo-5-methylthio-1-phosphopentane phosphatase